MSSGHHDHLGHDEHSLEPIRYPRQNVVAVIDTAEQMEDAVNELTAGGFLESEIGIGSGADIADRMRETTGRSGFTAMAMRFSEALGVPNDESEVKARYEQAMRDGRFVVAVLAPGCRVAAHLPPAGARLPARPVRPHGGRHRRGAGRRRRLGAA